MVISSEYREVEYNELFIEIQLKVKIIGEEKIFGGSCRMDRDYSCDIKNKLANEVANEIINNFILENLKDKFIEDDYELENSFLKNKIILNRINSFRENIVKAILQFRVIKIPEKSIIEFLSLLDIEKFANLWTQGFFESFPLIKINEIKQKYPEYFI